MQKLCERAASELTQIYLLEVDVLSLAYIYESFIAINRHPALNLQMEQSEQ